MPMPISMLMTILERRSRSNCEGGRGVTAPIVTEKGVGGESAGAAPIVREEGGDGEGEQAGEGLGSNIYTPI